jgi:hypothetical protein
MLLAVFVRGVYHFGSSILALFAIDGCKCPRVLWRRVGVRVCARSVSNVVTSLVGRSIVDA